MNFDKAEYLNLGTYRKSGICVNTPVWFAEENGFFYVLSNNQAGKIKRLKNSSRCRIAPCSVLGALHGDWVDSEAFIIDNEPESRKAHNALTKKYGFKMRMLDVGALVGRKINQRSFIRIIKP